MKHRRFGGNRCLSTPNMDFIKISDHIASGEDIRDFRQILGEHARHIINVARHYGDGSSRLALLTDQEMLTDLHQEWADKVTKRSDPYQWKRVAKNAVRSHSHRVLELISAHAERANVTTVSHARGEHQLALNLAAEFHCSLDENARVAQNGELHDLWKTYGDMINDTIDALVVAGPNSDMFYRRAASCMKTALALGSTLDTLKL